MQEAGVEVVHTEFDPFYEATEKVRQDAALNPVLADLIQQIQSIP